LALSALAMKSLRPSGVSAIEFGVEPGGARGKRLEESVSEASPLGGEEELAGMGPRLHGEARLSGGRVERHHPGPVPERDVEGLLVPRQDALVGVGVGGKGEEGLVLAVRRDTRDGVATIQRDEEAAIGRAAQAGGHIQAVGRAHLDRRRRGQRPIPGIEGEDVHHVVGSAAHEEPLPVGGPGHPAPRLGKLARGHDLVLARMNQDDEVLAVARVLDGQDRCARVEGHPHGKIRGKRDLPAVGSDRPAVREEGRSILPRSRKLA
jgi:hypothetical protein